MTTPTPEPISHGYSRLLLPAGSYSHQVAAIYADDVESLAVGTSSLTIGSPPVEQPGTRSVALDPFTAESPWRRPLPTSVTFEAANSPTTLSIAWDTKTTGNYGYSINQATYSHKVITATMSDPLVSVTDTGDNSRSFGTNAGVRIPIGALPAAGTDGHLHVRQPNSTYVIELISAQQISDTHWEVSRCAFVDHAGDGLGPHDTRSIFTNGLLSDKAGNGTRATGGSARAGLVSAAEIAACEEWGAKFLAGENPDPTDLIPHPLAIGFPPEKLRYRRNEEDVAFNSYYQGGTTDATYQPGWDVGQSRWGFMAEGEYVFPASEVDWTAKSSYTGQLTSTPGSGIPMGLLMAIPGNVDPYANRISHYEIPFVVAAQNYGAYCLDRAGDFVLYFETDASGDMRRELLQAPSWTARPVRNFAQKLRVVVGNSQSMPGGAAPSAPLRRPLAAPLEV